MTGIIEGGHEERNRRTGEVGYATGAKTNMK